LNFITIDVETANADLASICQIGIAQYADGKLNKEWSSLINPEDYFDSINISIHGITEEDVAGCPTFPQVVDILAQLVKGRVCVSHTAFDRVSISQSLAKYGLKQFDIMWLDSAKVARRTWEDCARRGYGLASLCEKIGYKFKHHDALEDAKAAGQVLLAAIKVTGIDIESWLKRVKQPIGGVIKREGNPEGELYGEIVVFTGALEITRREAADLAASLGCSVNSGVTKETTLLVVGNQDVWKLAGKEKSSKHLKAEQLIAKGYKIRIIKESDFKALVNNVQSSEQEIIPYYSQKPS
jgi:DNA polymerase-3 subunit epsilon